MVKAPKMCESYMMYYQREEVAGGILQGEGPRSSEQEAGRGNPGPEVVRGTPVQGAVRGKTLEVVRDTPGPEVVRTPGPEVVHIPGPEAGRGRRQVELRNQAGRALES